MSNLMVLRATAHHMSQNMLQEANRSQFSKTAGNMTRRHLIRTAALAIIPLLWTLPPVVRLARGSGGTGVAALVISLIITAVVTMRVLKLRDLIRLKHEPLHAVRDRSNDPAQAIPALDTLVESLRADGHDWHKIERLHDRAMSRLQTLLPRKPLHSLIRYGYYPSRPRRLIDGDMRVVNHDESSPQAHWDRMFLAAEHLREMATSEYLFTEKEVENRLSMLIPPLRAVLRARGLTTHRIDYMPSSIADPKVFLLKPSEQPDPDTKDEDGPLLDGDALTPVDDRLNASATMIASSIRTLEMSFRSSEEDFFGAVDLDMGRHLLAKHLPSLVQSYIVAHDATQGEERDQVRAEFAKGLGVVRDALAGIMRRHAEEARRRMEDETRFLQMRHGDNDPLNSDDRTAPRSTII